MTAALDGMVMDADELKRVACGRIDQSADELSRLGKDLWNKPELAFEEHFAHDRLTSFLQANDFPVEKKYVVDTGFRSVVSFGSGPNVALLCEYDALPEIGHACGHNLIAEVGVGASLGVKAALDAAKLSGIELGTLTVLGCPAEECGGGGKIDLEKGGAFRDVDAAMMCHPYPRTIPKPLKFAMQIVHVRYHGKASHAAGFPWEGVNALDAAVMAYSSISCMRQQMKPSWRIHGVITNGGAKPNIIPEVSELEYYIRTPSMGELSVLIERATGCFRAAATATGCRIELDWHPKPYANVMTNSIIADAYISNGEKIGVEFCKDEAKLREPSGSTDMGNVSQVVPSIHPMFYIASDAAPHTREFAVAAGSPDAQPYTLAQAKSLAMTAVDLLSNPQLLEAAHTEFKQSLLSEDC